MAASSTAPRDPVATATSARVGRDAALTFAGLMVANVLNYVFYALVSRAIGVEAYGTFSSLVGLVLILSGPALIAQMIVAKLATDCALAPERLAQLVRAVDRLAFGVSLAAGAALAAASFGIAGFLRINDPLLVTYAGVALFGALMLPFLRGVLQGTAAFRAFALSVVAETFAKAALAPVFGLIAGVRGAVAGMAVGYALAAGATYLMGRPHREGSHERLALRTVILGAIPVALAVSCINGMLFFDVVLAKRYLDPRTAGLYGAAALASRALYAIVAFIPTVLLPQAALTAARGQRTRWLFAQAAGAGAAIGAGAIAFFALFPTFVITAIAGRAFASGAPLLVPYVYAIAMLSLANIVATYDIARGRMRFVVPLVLVAAGEIVAMVLRHENAGDFLRTIAVGHTLALAACAVSLGRSRGPTAGSTRMEGG
jgi:O-antigen/teichoic acid export membrane protein